MPQKNSRDREATPGAADTSTNHVRNNITPDPDLYSRAIAKIGRRFGIRPSLAAVIAEAALLGGRAI